MNRELPKTYEPQEAEGRIYEMWEKNGCFEGKRDPQKKPFTIVMPPPNVTGQLHMGHAMDNATLQDILIRFKRMEGYDALWLPGTDHAGIATQIQGGGEGPAKKEGLTRYDLGGTSSWRRCGTGRRSTAEPHRGAAEEAWGPPATGSRLPLHHGRGALQAAVRHDLRASCINEGPDL
jgi:hypothetical protein